jgi:amidase
VPIGADFLSGVPTFVKDKVDVARMPTKRGTDAWTRRGLPILTASSPAAPGRLDDSGGQSADVEVRIQGLGRTPATRPGPQSLQTDHTAGASSSGSSAFVPAGAMPIAHANDGGGTIRVSRPAANLSDETN